jgi:hypothetical protein
MSNGTDNMNRLAAMATIFSGIITAFVWLSGRTTLPEMVFGKDAEVVLAEPVANQPAAQKEDFGKYRQYADSVVKEYSRNQDNSISSLRQQLDSVRNKGAGTTTPPPPPGDCNLNNAEYKNHTDHITFHSAKGNVYQFNGVILIYPVSGKAIYRGDKLSIITGSGNVTGEMKLMEGCAKLIGTLKQGDDLRDVNLYRSN